MDAFKIIKKHGVPAGVPVITAYVDPNAPGEGGGKLYQHNLIFTPSSHIYVLSILTKDVTPWTLDNFKQFLIEHNYTSTSNALRLNPTTTFVPPKAMRENMFVYTTNNKINVRYMQYNFAIVDNDIKISQAGVFTNEELSTLQDDVLEI